MCKIETGGGMEGGLRMRLSKRYISVAHMASYSMPVFTWSCPEYKACSLSVYDPFFPLSLRPAAAKKLVDEGITTLEGWYM